MKSAGEPNSKLLLALRFLRRDRLRKVFKRSRSGRGATVRGWRMCGGGGGRVGGGFLWKCVVRERAVSLRSRGAPFHGVRMGGGGGGSGGRVGSGFSRKLLARVETQAHLAFRCDPEWGMRKCSGFKPFSPRAFVVSFSSCFNSKLLLALRFPRRDRLRKVFKRSLSGRGANVRGWRRCGGGGGRVGGGFLRKRVVRERAVSLRSRGAPFRGLRMGGGGGGGGGG